MMKVKILDCEHEKDLEDDINKFIDEKDPKIIDIKYNIAAYSFGDEQIYCYSALILYR